MERRVEGQVERQMGKSMRLSAVWGMALALGLAAVPAGADEADEWHVQVAPYLWMASLDGDLATISGLPTADVDASFSDIFENLDLALMVQGEVRYRRVGFLLDLAYLGLSADENTPGPLFSEVDVENDTFFTTLGPFYRALERDRVTLDVFGGMRIWYVDTRLEFETGLVPGVQSSDDETWVDPLIGARGSVQILRSLSASAAVDIGGFGAASDFTWQLLGTLDFDPFSWLTLRAGYRHLDVDYDNSGFVFDAAMSGPILGAVLHL